MKYLRIVITHIFKEKKDVILSLIFAFLAGVAAVALFANSGYLVSKAALEPPLYVLTLSIALLKLFSVIRAVSRYLERYFSHRATFTMLSDLRTSFFSRLEPLAATIFHSYKSGDLLARIVGDVESLQNFFLRVVYPPIVMVSVFLATTIFTAFFSIEITLLLILGLIVTGFIVPCLFVVWRQTTEASVREKRGELSIEITEFLRGFFDLKIYQKLTEKEKLLEKITHSYDQNQKRSNIQALYNHSINNFMSLLIAWGVIAIGAYLVYTNRLSGVFLAMLILIALTVFESATPLATFSIFYEESRTAATRLFSVVKKKDINNDVDIEKKDHFVTGTPSIDMTNVSFHFGNEERPTLININLTIPPRSKTAIIGPSGSGKSTIIALLLKLYNHYNGEIKFHGTNFKTLSNEFVWEKINPVLQHNHFFYGTIKENLLLANDNASDLEMKHALKVVKLEHFSLDDIVMEQGANLSGGEKQKLAIARAFLKGGDLWLLDEPTSSIDSLTEAEIFTELLKKDETMIIVSHRLNWLHYMDQIIVIDSGSIVESGTYQQLMENKGYFYELKRIEENVFVN